MSAADKTKLDGLVTNATHTGEVTGSGALTITNKAVTYAKIQDVSAISLLGNPTGSSAAASEITLGSGLSFSGTTLTATGSGGTVTSVATGTGLTGGTITGTGTIKMADMDALSVKGNATNSSSAPTDIAAGSDGYVLRRSGTALGFGQVATAGIADNAVDGTKINLTGNVTGDIMYYDGTDWVRLPAGTSGKVLQTNGAGNAPTWTDPTSAVTASNGLTITGGSNVTLGGTLTGATTVTQNNNDLTFTTGTAKTVVNGSFKMGGAVYGTIRKHETADNVTWTETDYVVVIINNGIYTKFALPDPHSCPGRILCIRNATNASLVPAAHDPLFPGHNYPLNTNNIAAVSSSSFISDGDQWYLMTGR
jgi:hypothetical protein